jgi:hypothetical protein
MSSEAPLLLHVGLPKTATTALQEHVFSDLPGTFSIGKPDPPRALKKVLRRVISEGERDFQPDDLALVRAALSPHAGCTTILSHEGLTATRHEMRASDRFLRVAGFRMQRALVAERLREACGAARVQVFFTVREQCSWLLSLYGDLVQRENLAVPFDVWLESGMDELGSFAGDPDFAWLVGVYATHFGAENVHVLVFEELLEAPERFAAKLAAGLLEESEVRRRIACLPRIKANEDLGELAAASVSRHSKDRCGPEHVRPQIPKEMPDALRDRVRALCRAGNRRLEERYGAPLAEYGYAS